MISDVSAFRVHIFASDFGFELEWMNVSGDHSSSHFAHSFDFRCLAGFARVVDLSWVVSLW